MLVDTVNEKAESSKRTHTDGETERDFPLMENTQVNIEHGENPPPYYLVVKPVEPPPPYTRFQPIMEVPPVFPHYSNQPFPHVLAPHEPQHSISITQQEQPDQRPGRLVVMQHKKAYRYGGSGGSVFILLLVVIAIWLGVRYGISLISKAKSDTCPTHTVICDGRTDCLQGSDESICVRFGEGNELQIMTSNSSNFLPVCYKNWNQNLATQTCEQLGFRGSYQYGSLTLTSSSFLLVTSQTSDLIQGNVDIGSSSCPDKKAVYLQCSDCGRPQTSSRIIGGNVSAPGQWPWQASLHYKGSHVCGGTVVSQDFIVSAAHCFASVPTSWQVPVNWNVYLGVESQYNLPVPQHVANIMIHELYDEKTHNYDIALLKLTWPINFTSTVQPVCLPVYNQVLQPNTQCWTTGFGVTQNGEDLGSSQLMQVAVNIIDSSLCNKVYNGVISNEMLCAGDMNGGKGTCQGDSGGPLVNKGDDGRWYLYGVTSWRIGCGLVNKPSVYSNVHSLLDWIHSKMEQDFTSFRMTHDHVTSSTSP